ncbi:pentatricopeptide repeat-containing protein [Pyrus ussuriensis x Pyrus communis]|uniref:Pentatricopeptide repeat-containing protein n=1 Tax=Pyrus ussuriensis x Pyrus communis TaxID=2448454 RepID=A0A5N5EXC9_9ROSA|nr:pentatricopeptide repeat-containing protein [Pyrus ussuriensis x Pyrus communis]
MREQVWRWSSLERKCLDFLQQANTTSSLLQIHAFMLRNSLDTNVNLLTKFITTCSHQNPIALIRHARRVFDQRPNKDDTFLCNSMIRAHMENRQFGESFTLYRNLRQESEFEPDCYTFTALAKACGLDMAIWEGQELHCQVVKIGLSLDLYVSTSLVDMYAKFGRMIWAGKVFDKMTHKSQVSWTALICGYARSGDMSNARRLFDRMPDKDSAAFNAMIDGYVKLGDMGLACILFDEMTDRNVVSWTSMISGYCHHGDIHSARSLFDAMPKKNLISWNAMIGGYSQNNQPHEALKLFQEMQSTTSLELDGVTVVSILPAIADLGALALGRWVDKKENFMPNNITFIGVLSACNHCGLVEEGKRWFKAMESFGLIPQIEHYGCMVDVLGRAGCLEEVEKLIEVMPYDPNGIILSSFLFACGHYGDVTRANEVLKKVAKLEPGNDGNYVMLRNLYARKRRWSDAEEIKRLMRKNQANKEIGCSVIEVNGRIEEFVAGDRVHTHSEAIHLTLLQGWKHMMGEGSCTSSSSTRISEILRISSSPFSIFSSKLLIQAMFTRWKNARVQDRRNIFNQFMKENVRLSKVDNATVITGVVTPPVAMAAKRAGEGVPQLKMIKAIPDVVFVPSATVLALISVKIYKRIFTGKNASSTQSEPDIQTKTETIGEARAPQGGADASSVIGIHHEEPAPAPSY